LRTSCIPRRSWRALRRRGIASSRQNSIFCFCAFRPCHAMPLKRALLYPTHPCRARTRVTTIAARGLVRGGSTTARRYPLPSMPPLSHAYAMPFHDTSTTFVPDSNMNAVPACPFILLHGSSPFTVLLRCGWRCLDSGCAHYQHAFYRHAHCRHWIKFYKRLRAPPSSK